MTERVVAFTADLLFASNITATLERAGYAVTIADDLASFEAGLADEAAVVILDLHAGPAAAEIVARANGAPVLAFGRHTEPAVLRAAREAGCAAVVVRSTFVAEMADLVGRLAGGRQTAG